MPRRQAAPTTREPDTPVHRFWTLSKRGGPESKRWQIWTVDDRAGRVAGVALRKGRPATGWEPLAFTWDDAPSFEDMPWALDDLFVVSDRLRAFLEAEAPGAASYHPVSFSPPKGHKAPKDPYWAMNWLRLIDCLDEDASMNVDDEGKRYVEFPVIDPRRVPADAVLGCIKGYEVNRIVRDDLRKKIKKTGFTGPQFLEIPHITDGPPNFKKVDWSKPRPK